MTADNNLPNIEPISSSERFVNPVHEMHCTCADELDFLRTENEQLRAALESIASGNVGAASAPLVAREALDRATR